MDYFKSVVLNRDVLSDIDGHALVENLSHDLVGNDDPQMNILVDGLDEDELYIDTQSWGWWDGGLHKLLRQRAFGQEKHDPMYFRGAALFHSFDDAKNDYLMNPEMEAYTERQVTEEQHIPFGMVVPQWRNLTHEEMRGREQHDHRDKLVSVTIILFWQDL